MWLRSTLLLIMRQVKDYRRLWINMRNNQRQSTNSDDLCPSQINPRPPRLTYIYAHITRSTYVKLRGFACVLQQHLPYSSENPLPSGSSEPPALMFTTCQFLADKLLSPHISYFLHTFISPKILMRAEEAVLGGGGAGIARQWTSLQRVRLTGGVTGSGKWAGRIQAGRSPCVRGNVPSSAADLRIRAARWHRRGGSAAGWDAEAWSRRGRGRGEDAGGGKRKRS